MHLKSSQFLVFLEFLLYIQIFWTGFDLEAQHVSLDRVQSHFCQKYLYNWQSSATCADISIVTTWRLRCTRDKEQQMSKFWFIAGVGNNNILPLISNFLTLMNFRRRCTGFGTKKVYLKFYGQISQWKIPMQYQSNQHEIPLSRERSFPNEENALFSLPILRKGRNKVGVLLFLRQTLTCVAPLRQGRGCVPPAQPTSRIFRKRYLFRWQKNEGKRNKN